VELRARREIAIVGSVALHVAIFAIGVATCSSRAPARRGTTRIELVDVQLLAPPVIEKTLDAIDRGGDEAAGGGGGSPPVIQKAKPAPKPTPAKKPAPRPEPPREPVEPEKPDAATVTASATATAAATASAIASAATATSEAGSGGGIGGGHGSGKGTGTGSGIGAGTGTGTGTGTGGKRARPISKARPAKLLWPTRQREEVEEWVFVVMLTVDTDGGVVGAKLIKGHSLHDNEKALDAVWRFHYDPALDHAGRPVRSQVRQRFMIR
jgi:protein TonB